MAENGAEEFYTGETAEKLVQDVRAEGRLSCTVPFDVPAIHEVNNLQLFHAGAISEPGI